MEDCIFCKIVEGKVPCSKVYENEDCLAFLDIAPATPKKGHILVIPKQHFKDLVEINPNILNNLIQTVKLLTTALMQDADGVNIMQNNGEAANQLVKHLHFHLVPRYKNDNVKLGTWETFSYNTNEITETAEKIKKLLNKN